MTQFEYRRLTNSQDEQQLGAILSQCFGSSLTESQQYFNRLGRENFRIICQGGKVIGGLAIYWMGQWYGGKCVPMAGIAAVGVAPEYRGTGAAYALMKHTLQELHRSGGAISTLYAATQVLYRKVGYEQGGTRSIWELPTATIQLKERQPMQRIPLDYEFSPIYRQQAQAHNGNLDRNSAIWQQVVSAKDDPVYADLLGTFDQPEGYVIFTQRQESGVATIIIKDWVLLTPGAIRRFWTFLADHRSQIERVWWQSSSLDPLVLLLREQTAKMIRQERWMLRVINVPLALEKRGYPTIDAQLHLQVHDDLIPANNGRFCLTVAQGQGKVTPGGQGELRLDIHGLASLYTGLFTPYQLQLTGYLEATPEALATATQLFSGTAPWMPDFF